MAENCLSECFFASRCAIVVDNDAEGRNDLTWAYSAVGSRQAEAAATVLVDYATRCTSEVPGDVASCYVVAGAKVESEIGFPRVDKEDQERPAIMPEIA